MLGLAASLAKGGASLLTFVKDNLKLYLDFKSSRSDTLAFPSEGSTSYSASTQTYIDFGDNDDLDMGTSSFTCAGWIKLNADSGTSKMMLGKTQNASGAKWSFGVSGSEKVFISISDGSTSKDETGATTISIGEWVHVAGVYDTDADTLSVFLNGVQDATMSASGVGSLSNSLNLRSGRGAEYPYNYNNNFQVANIAIWKRPLSPEEVQSVMNKSYSQLGSVEKTSLVSWWALDSAKIDGSELWDADASTFDSGTHSWVKYSSDNGMENDSGALKITRPSSGGDNRGAYVWLRDISDLSTDLIIGVTYKFTFDAKVNSGSSVVVAIGGPVGANVTVTETSFTSKSITFTATQTTTNYVGMALMEANEIIWLDNFSLKAQVTTDFKNSNNGTVVGATTTTSVYGGNAPVLPRAIDIAESFADAIGNGSASFNGSSDFVEVADSQVLQTNNDMTITAWVNPTGTTSNRVFLSKRDSGGTNYQFYMSNDTTPKLRFFAGSDAYSSTDTLTKDEWQYVAISINSGVTNGSVFYINGIASGAFTFTISANDAPLVIGKHPTSNTYYNGQISQVGLWQGALTQAQIQSLMESTSYAKIPADVKSTLGANTLNPPTSSSSEVGWNTDTEVLTFTENRFALWDNATTKNSTLYKFQYEILTRTAGGLAEGGGSSGWSFGNLPDTVGVHTIYKVSRSDATGSGNNNDYLQIQCTGFRGTIGSISVKEVINDLVAYYPLDADSSNTSSLGITNDSVGGETLGINLIDNHSKDRWIAEGGNSDDDITNGVQLIFGGGANGNYAYINDALLSTAGLASDTLYKTTFTASYSGGSSAPSIRLNDGTTSYDNVLTTTPTEYEVYFQKNGSAYLQIVNQVTSNVTDVINWEIKEVTSNTGVLK